jgi:hypothetical protein
MTSAPSPQGRRILVAVVTGEAGRRIQSWREENDPEQARRLPPHATLCYWAPDVGPDVMEKQVRHAFEEPVSVCLGKVKKGDNDQQTFFVEVTSSELLDRALHRLYDGAHVAMPPLKDRWQWHVTCVRDSRDRDLDALWQASEALDLDCEWRVAQVSFLKLDGAQYSELASWRV